MHKAYALAFAAYLLRVLNEPKTIRKVILFGSAARNEAAKQSDIDIFIETEKKDKRLENKIDSLIQDFYSSREYIQFKLLGISNSIHVITGSLNEWKELKKSIESTGIILYAPYISSEISGKKHLLISWESIGKNRGAFLNKLYGFNAKDKKYSGLIEKYSGKKIGKSSIMLPIEHKEEIFNLIKNYKVSAKILEIYY